MSTPVSVLHRQRGVTLIEIALFSLISASLAAVLLKDEQLIDAARMKALIAQQSQMKTAYGAFQDRYLALPGHYASATLTIPGVTASGNGNGRVEPNATPVGGQHAVRDAVDMGTPGAQRHAERRRRVRPEQSDPIDAGEPVRRLRRHPLQQPIRQSIHPRHRSSHPDHRQLRAGAVADGDRSQARRRQRPRRPVPVLRASLGRGATGGTGHARRLHRSDRRVAGGDRGSADELRGAWLL